MEDDRVTRAENDARSRRFMRMALRDAPRGARTRLAEETGLSNATITKWGQGTLAPAREHWPVIAHCFHLSADFLAAVFDGRDTTDEQWGQIGEGVSSQREAEEIIRILRVLTELFAIDAEMAEARLTARQDSMRSASSTLAALSGEAGDMDPDEILKGSSPGKKPRG